MKVIMLGAPGAGKGTQAKRVAAEYGIPHISTGDIFRANIKGGTELGKKAKSYMDAGNLVPDELTVDLVIDRVAQPDCEKGYILDGFPRTIPQAEALDKMGIVIDKVIDIEVKDEAIVKRMSGRRVCEKCGASYHMEYKKPAVDGVCDRCAGTLVQRKDDHPDTVNARLEVYHKETEPLKDYYANQGKLSIVEGQATIEDTTALILKAVEE